MGGGLRSEKRRVSKHKRKYWVHFREILAGLSSMNLILFKTISGKGNKL
jgi:hypothetical protein